MDSLRACFTSYRTFADGPVVQPFPESDPANIAFALGCPYFSFYTLKRLTNRQLEQTFVSFDLIIVEVNLSAIELSRRIIEACHGRAATYSEGHIGDYQSLSPTDQVSFLKTLNEACMNFVYWERYVPFYQSLTSKPVEYLPYPYMLELAQARAIPIKERPALAAIPTGLAGGTRNGLASLAVAKRLQSEGLIAHTACWLEGDSFDEDRQAVGYFMHGTPPPLGTKQVRFHWRKWLLEHRVDYRSLLWLKGRLQSSHNQPHGADMSQLHGTTFYRRGGWLSFIGRLAASRVVIDLNNRETVGRLALDCAALKIACIAANRSDMQTRLFPRTSLADSWDVDEAFQIAKRCLGDDEFYYQVVSYAAEAAQQFDAPAFRRRFEDIIARHPEIIPREP
ncbi:MAG: hypothetical protein HYR71_02325, partial [Chloroflexi bacterium]|nr:hypothetical protein [Chloroflexota bacterium]